MKYLDIGSNIGGDSRSWGQLTISLTDTVLRSLRPLPRARKIADSKGLYIEIAPSNSCHSCYDSGIRKLLISSGLEESLRTPNADCSGCHGRGVAGGKWWRLKYRHQGKEKRISLGVYPDVSLKDARKRRDDARKFIAQGVDPSQHRRSEKRAAAERSANDFESIAREWFNRHKKNWADSHSDRMMRGWSGTCFRTQEQGRSLS